MTKPFRRRYSRKRRFWKKCLQKTYRSRCRTTILTMPHRKNPTDAVRVQVSFVPSAVIVVAAQSADVFIVFVSSVCVSSAGVGAGAQRHSKTQYKG